MSYILDALKKADAQRERDPARGIHAQPLRGSAGRPGPRGVRPWLWGAAALGGAALTTASWYLFQDRDAVDKTVAERVAPAVQAPAAVAAPVTPVPALVVGTAVLPTPVSAPAPAAASAIEPPPPPPTARSAMAPPRDPRATSSPNMRGGPPPGAMTQTPGAAPAPMAPAITTPVPTVTATTPSMPGTASPQAPAAAPMAPPMPAAAPINPPPPPPVPPPALPPAPPTPPVAGLPADAPKLAISGGVYSTNPAQRMLIVNGQVFNEGSEVSPGVVLEEIRSKGSAVLRFRGSRYTVRY